MRLESESLLDVHLCSVLGKEVKSESGKENFSLDTVLRNEKNDRNTSE